MCEEGHPPLGEENMRSVRSVRSVRSHILDVAGNYPGATKYKASRWMCQACNMEVKEDQ